MVEMQLSSIILLTLASTISAAPLKSSSLEIDVSDTYRFPRILLPVAKYSNYSSSPQLPSSLPLRASNITSPGNYTYPTKFPEHTWYTG